MFGGFQIECVWDGRYQRLGFAQIPTQLFFQAAKVVELTIYIYITGSKLNSTIGSLTTLPLHAVIVYPNLLLTLPPRTQCAPPSPLNWHALTNASVKCYCATNDCQVADAPGSVGCESRSFIYLVMVMSDPNNIHHVVSQPYLL